MITGIAALMLVSCAKDDIPSKGEDFSQDPVSVLLNQYCAKRETGTRNILAGVDVRNIERHYYTLSGDGVSEVSSDTRSAGDETTTFEIARADFELDGRRGYAYICTHPKAEGVYLYTDNGVIADTVENKGLAGMIEAVPYAAGGIIDAGAQPRDTVSQLDPSLNIAVGPLLRTRWGQDMPYNECAPKCVCSECDGNENCAIGCVTTAVAQTMAYCKRFSGTFYGNKNLPFARMTSKPFASQLDSTVQIHIAPFFHEVALCCQIQFRHNSGTTLKSAYNYLEDLGYFCSFDEGGVDKAKLFKNITMHKIPQIITGSGSGGDHAWVIDGWRQIDDKVEYHNNWGWSGSSDCWIDHSLIGKSKFGNHDYSGSFQTIYITGY